MAKRLRMKACPSKPILAREVIMHEQKCSETEVRQVLPVWVRHCQAETDGLRTGPGDEEKVAAGVR